MLSKTKRRILSKTKSNAGYFLNFKRKKSHKQNIEKKSSKLRKIRSLGGLLYTSYTYFMIAFVRQTASGLKHKRLARFLFSGQNLVFSGTNRFAGCTRRAVTVFSACLFYFLAVRCHLLSLIGSENLGARI